MVACHGAVSAGHPWQGSNLINLPLGESNIIMGSDQVPPQLSADNFRLDSLVKGLTPRLIQKLNVIANISATV